jgi:hypothetical protein
MLMHTLLRVVMFFWADLLPDVPVANPRRANGIQMMTGISILASWRPFRPQLIIIPAYDNINSIVSPTESTAR